MVIQTTTLSLPHNRVDGLKEKETEQSLKRRLQMRLEAQS